MHDFYDHLSEVYFIFIVQRGMLDLILPPFYSLTRKHQLGSCSVRKLLGTAQKIRMDMRLSYFGNFQVLLFRKIQVSINVPLGIHHNSLASGLTSKYIAGLR